MRAGRNGFCKCLEYKSQVAESSTQVVQKDPKGICIHNLLFIIPCGSGKEFSPLSVKTEKEQVFRQKAISKNKAVVFLCVQRTTRYTKRNVP